MTRRRDGSTKWKQIDDSLRTYRKRMMESAVKLRHQVQDGFFKFKPFSSRQIKVLTWWCDKSTVKDYQGIIADGSIRSGKTICMSLSYVIWAMSKFDGQNFAICGKTIGSLRRNVIFWLRLMLRSRGYTVKEHRADNLMIVRRENTINYFYFFGGKDERSQDLIQGITLAGVLFDEVALMPQSFVNQATARCSVEGSKFWFNCNPQGPQHWFYTEWIKKCKNRRLLYLHFTMEDNLSLSDSIKDRYRQQFSGVFYRRYVLGQWSIASGAIYDMFSGDKNVREIAEPFPRCFVAIDYGTQNPCVFGLIRAKNEGGRIYHYMCKEYYHDGRKTFQKTDEQYSADLRAFVFGEKVEYVVVDPSAASLITQLRKDGFRVLKAKNDVISGISKVAVELSNGDLTIDPSCENTLREMSGYVWDEKAANRGEDKPVKVDDHCMDMLRYGIYTDCQIYSSGRKTNSYRG